MPSDRLHCSSSSSPPRGSRRFPAPPWSGAHPIDVGATVRARWASFGKNDSTVDQVTGSAFGAALDVGAVVPLTSSATLGVTGRDVVNILNWDTSARGSYEENVPPALILGLAVELCDDVAIEINLDKALHQDNHDLVMVGAEATFFRVAALRGGYRKALPPGGLEEFSLGGGAKVSAGDQDITLDAAYLFGRLENTLRFGAGFAF